MTLHFYRAALMIPLIYSKKRMPFVPCLLSPLFKTTAFVASDDEPPDLHAPPLLTQAERRTFHFTLTFCSVRRLILSLFYFPFALVLFSRCSAILAFTIYGNVVFLVRLLLAFFFSLCTHFWLSHSARVTRSLFKLCYQFLLVVFCSL